MYIYIYIYICVCHLIYYIQFLEELEDQGSIIDGCGLNVHHAKFFFQSFRQNIIRTKKTPKNLQQKEDNGWLSRKKWLRVSTFSMCLSCSKRRLVCWFSDAKKAQRLRESVGFS